MNLERICLECGDVLHGRADQKYCNDQCRNAYHNRQLGKTSEIIRRINRLLRKNHAVLTALQTTGKWNVSKNELVKMGFHFGYFTHYQVLGQDRTVFYCYDRGYQPVNENRIRLVRRILQNEASTLRDTRR